MWSRRSSTCRSLTWSRPGLVKALYVLAVDVAGLLGVLGVAYALSRSLLTGLLVALVAGSVFAVFVLAVRIWLEALLVVFRLADDTAEMLEHEAAIAMNTSRTQVPSGRGSDWTRPIGRE